MKRQTIRIDLYGIIARAVEAGVTFGLNRCFKHVDQHTRESVDEDAICGEVMNALCEVVRFDDEEEETT